MGLIQTFTGAVLELGKQIANILTDTEFKSALLSISPPAYVTTGLSVLGIIMIMVRLRKTSADPVERL